MRKKNQLYRVEIKSLALHRENKRSFVTYFQGGNKKTIVSNIRKLYPQFTKPEDSPVVEITPISFRDYEAQSESPNLIKTRGKILHETLGD